MFTEQLRALTRCRKRSRIATGSYSYVDEMESPSERDILRERAEVSGVVGIDSQTDAQAMGTKR